MQIRNDYTSYQNRNYQEGHTHHVTECLQEDQVKKKEGSLGAVNKGDFGTENSTVVFSKDGDTFLMDAAAVMAEKKTDTGGSLIIRLWDALGEETSGEKHHTRNLLRDHLLSGIHGAAASVRDTFQHQIVERVQSVPVKVKTVLQSAGARFRRGKDTFAALTGGQTFSGKNNSHKEKRKDGQVTSARKEDDIPMKVLKHSHLSDSYSRRGEYCQLGDRINNK